MYVLKYTPIPICTDTVRGLVCWTTEGVVGVNCGGGREVGKCFPKKNLKGQ